MKSRTTPEFWDAFAQLPPDIQRAVRMKLPAELHPTDQIDIELPSGSKIHLPRTRPMFRKWMGPAIPFAYNNKPVLEYDGTPIFAELLVLRLLEKCGWDGVWVQTFGALNFLRTMPEQWNLSAQCVVIPPQRERFLSQILAGVHPKASFDVYAWVGNEIIFCEMKRTRKDTITQGQKRFVEAALSCGVSVNSLLIVEWSEAAMSSL